MLNRSLLYGGLSSLALFLVACPVNPGIASVTITPNTAQTLAVGATLKFTSTAVRVAGNTTASQAVTYNSSDTRVATIAADGTLTARAVGFTDVTAVSVAAPSIRSSAVRVTVQAPVAGVTGVTTTPAAGSTQSLAVGATLAATATVAVAPGSTAAQTVSWSSSNAAVATVSPPTGTAPNNAATVTGVTVGTAEIRATSTADPTKFSAFTVNVTAAPPPSSVQRRRNAGGAVDVAYDVPTGSPAFLADPTATNASDANGPLGPRFWNCGTTDNDTDQGLVDDTRVPASAILAPTTPNAAYAPAAVYATNHYCPTATVPARNPLRYDSTALAAGSYTVRLHFAETYYGAPASVGGNGAASGSGARVMTVTIASGATVTLLPASTPFDVYDLAGGALRPYYRDFVIPTPLTAGQELDLIIQTVSGNDPFVSGIEYIRTGP